MTPAPVAITAIAVGAQKANIRQVRWDSSCAKRSPSLASNRAKLSSFSSRRSAWYVASTALNQFTMRNAECGVWNAEL